MAARRVRVFVSSTYLDNKLRRQLVEQAIRSAGMEPVGMERFGASTHAPVGACTPKLGERAQLLGISRFWGALPAAPSQS